MRRRRAPLALMLAAILVPAAVVAGGAPPPDADSIRSERALLRHLHFEYGLVAACGLADDEAEAGYRLRASELEQRLGIADDAEARYRELNRGWTEADADWASMNGTSFRASCRDQAAAARDRFRQAFRDTGETLNKPRKGRKP